MATQKEMHELIGRIVMDQDFRASLAADPEEAVKAAGYELSDKQLTALKQADMQSLGEDLDERLSKSGLIMYPW